MVYDIFLSLRVLGNVVPAPGYPAEHKTCPYFFPKTPATRHGTLGVFNSNIPYDKCKTYQDFNENR